jgi:hypothetical protein
MSSNLPTREDHDLIADTDNTIEFQLFDVNGSIDLTNDLVKVYVDDDDGGMVLIPKVNGPGFVAHSDPAHGKTQVTFTRADLAVGRSTRWWYAVRRIVNGNGAERVHIVGELRVTVVAA